jgi:hypothetical protein
MVSEVEPRPRLLDTLLLVSDDHPPTSSLSVKLGVAARSLAKVSKMSMTSKIVVTGKSLKDELIFSVIEFCLNFRTPRPALCKIVRRGVSKEVVRQPQAAHPAGGHP